jgi:methylmalonyl-CoA mutase N-terminal domain/subunit
MTADTPKMNAIESVKVKLSRTKTWGGLDTKSYYGPKDRADTKYQQEIGDPGEYPYTRGISSELYRKRMWTLRNIVGYGAPEDTLEGIREALSTGTAGINVVVDALSQQCIDPDHPAFRVEVGAEGCSIPCVRDMERLLQDIDISRSGVAFHSTMMTYPLVAATAIKRGIPLEKLLGSHMPDHLQLTLSGWGNQLVPADLCHKTTVDCLEYSVKNSPYWALGIPQAYDLRERGLPPHGEIAVGMAIVNQSISDLMERGMSVDDIAPSMAWVSTSDIDFFEEVAKFRALRRVWAKTMKERFGATNPRSMSLRIACHTAGKSLVYQQPLNNLSRAAVQTLAALCGGVQSVETCTYDEPICIPTPEARELATRTQQILAHEVGAARTADPLGGSYYVESLTDEMEERAMAMLAEIEEMGLIQAVSSGYLEQMMDEHNITVDRELQEKERIMVGVNDFIPEAEPMPKRFSFDRANTVAHIERFIAMKQSRDNTALQQKLQSLYHTARSGANCHQAMIDALIADGSIAEVWGTVRMAHGYSYDPFNVIESPFSFRD